MKKIYLYSTYIVLLSLFCTSCKKSFLDETPKASTTVTNFYQNANDLQMAMAGIALDLNYPFSLVVQFYYAADDVSSKRAGNKLVFSDYDIFNPNASNIRQNTYFWNTFYATITQANQLIASYSSANQATEIQRNNAGGYAYFVRALSYFQFTRAYGDIPMPLINDPNKILANTSVADVYTQIVSDLQNAEKMLPNHWDKWDKIVQNGIDLFPTIGSAKALLADVYLTMAGWPLKQTDHYALAASKAKEVIDNASTWGYALLANYGDLWKIANKYNQETVFGCFYNTQTADIWNTPLNWQNGSEMGPPSLAPEDEGGWEDMFGELTFYKKFPAGARKDATYQKIYYPNNDTTKACDYTKTLWKHPHFLKFRDDPSYNWATHYANDWWGSMTSYVIRYAEVLLIYAESKAMSNSLDADAYTAINKVRNRAGLSDLKTGLTQTAFRDSVIAERGWEFAAEFGIRWFDLLRTETVAKVTSTRDAGEVSIAATPNDANHTFYWAPIPATK